MKKISLIENPEHLLIWVQCLVIDKTMLPMTTGQNIFENNKAFSRKYSLITFVSFCNKLFSQLKSYMTGIPTWKHRNYNNVLRLEEPSLQHTWLQSLCNRGLRFTCPVAPGGQQTTPRNWGSLHSWPHTTLTTLLHTILIHRPTVDKTRCTLIHRVKGFMKIKWTDVFCSVSDNNFN